MFTEIRLHQLNQSLSASDFLSRFFYSSKKRNDLFQKKLILRNEEGVLPSTILNASDSIFVDFQEENTILPGSSIPIILYEDDFFLAIKKKPGQIVYDLDHPNVETCDKEVSRYYREIGYKNQVRHLHRLDKDTSGILLYAKNPLSHAYLSESWISSVSKEYLCIIEGKLPKKKDTISLPIGKNRHKNNEYIVSPTGKEAITNVEVLREGEGVSLVKIQLETGRTHQIRVHLSHLGHPLVGDATYKSNLPANRVMLHASKITFTHPLSQKTVTISSSMNEDMKSFLKKRGIYEY